MLNVPEFHSGDPLTTEYLNSLARAIRELQANSITGVSGNITLSGGTLLVPEDDVIRIQNNSGADLAAYAVLGIHQSFYDPDNPNEETTFLQGEPIFVGITPDDSSHVGKFAVLLEAVANGAGGLARVSGATQVRVNIQTVGDKYAEIVNGSSTALISGATGSARILSIATDQTGEQWAVVMLAASALPPISDDTKNLTLTWNGTSKKLEWIEFIPWPGCP